MLTKAPRGTRDILPDKVGNWLYLENLIRKLCGQFGYREIRTPIFEHTELFQRGIGETTDVVEKEKSPKFLIRTFPLFQLKTIIGWTPKRSV